MFLYVGSVIAIIFIIGIIIVGISFFVILEEEKNNKVVSDRKQSSSSVHSDTKTTKKEIIVTDYYSSFLKEEDLKMVVEMVIDGRKRISKIEGLKPKHYPTALMREYNRLLFLFYKIEQFFLKSVDGLIILKTELSEHSIEKEKLSVFSCLELIDNMEEMYSNLKNKSISGSWMTLGHLINAEYEFLDINHEISVELFAIASMLKQILENYQISSFISNDEMFKLEYLWHEKFDGMLDGFYRS